MKLHILLIDDNKSVVGSFSSTFLQSDSPCKCTCADDVKHATQMLEFISPDFIFINLDVHFAEALEFIAYLRKKTNLRKIKIVSFSVDHLYYQCVTKAYGAHLCIQPPQNAEIIYEAINSFNIHTLVKVNNNHT